jgi:hypothetical protein
MLANQSDPRGERFRDGVMTQRQTFQKYYTQHEIKDFLTDALDEEPIPVAPGVLYVFRDKDAEQRFLVERYRSRRSRLRDPSVPARAPRISTRRDRRAEQYAACQEPLERLWDLWLGLGRRPEKADLASVDLLRCVKASAPSIRPCAFSMPCIGSGKLTLMRFDDFDGRALPRMLERVKIKMRAQDVDVFEYGERFEPPFLYRKSRFMNEEHPGYPEQVAFDEALVELEARGLFDLSGYGPSAAELLAILERHRWEVDGLRLQRVKTPSELDDPCGQFLRFRDLVECGETWQRLAGEGGFDNRPRQPESYTALMELAEQVLDPVIDWFGMVELTYGFCSPGLAREIPGRIDPKRDQHAAHERNRLGRLVCPRRGAAVDFVIADEDMLEVARWVAANTPFDRLYFYGADKPIHVSYGPEHSRQVVTMRPGPSGRLVPRVFPVEAFSQAQL